MSIKLLFRNWREFHAEDVKQMLASPDRKSLVRLTIEATNLLWRYRHPPVQYLKSGLYLKNSTSAWQDHVPPRLIWKLQRKLNPIEARIFVRDKQRFRLRMEKAGLPVMRELLSVDLNSVIRDADGTVLDPGDAAARLQKDEFFAKPIDGIHGRDTALIRPGDDVSAYLTKARNIIVQPRIRQHPLLNRLYPHAVNTVRIDTLHTAEGWVNSAAVLRLGRGGNVVDNGATGGIMVGIDLETGRLRATGSQKPKFSSSVYVRHPDTGTIFKDFTLPHWALLRETVARAAEEMLPLKSLGWDVAITEEGVLLVEANDNWDVNVSQLGWGGLADTPIGRMACELHGLKTGKAAA